MFVPDNVLSRIENKGTLNLLDPDDAHYWNNIIERVVIIVVGLELYVILVLMLLLYIYGYFIDADTAKIKVSDL